MSPRAALTVAVVLMGVLASLGRAWHGLLAFAGARLDRLDPPSGHHAALTPAPTPAQDDAATDVPPSSEAAPPAPVPSAPQGPGLALCDDTVPLRRASAQDPYAGLAAYGIPGQRTPTAPNPALKPLPLVPRWLIPITAADGSERYRMANPRRWLDARQAAKSVTP